MARLISRTRQLLADIETPVSAFLKLGHGRADSLLLESAEAHEQVGRYSILAFDPLASLELHADKAVVSDAEGTATHAPERFFDLIRTVIDGHRVEDCLDLPAVGSMAGYIGYDAVRLIEKLAPAPEADHPIARLVLPSVYVIFDNVQRRMHLVALAEDEDRAAGLLDGVEAGLAGPPPAIRPGSRLEMTPPPKERYLEAVKRAREYIVAGDIFQVVLADRFSGRTDADPFQLYRLLRAHSPSPYMFFLDFGGLKLVGASPETLVKVGEGRVELHPIAGTRGRSHNQEEDLALERELLASEKERAEHTMLVDLARNDASRVCIPASVAVDPYMAVQRFSHVMHIVSLVRGDLAEEADAVDAFQAAFPAGTVSGAPKVRAMEIIDELESVPRGVYSGAVGWFGRDGKSDTCIGIRMIVFEGRQFTIPVGAGIVADSIPEMEYREIEHKAAQSIAVLKKAVGGEER